jgi:hypothetical protein
MKGSMKPCGRLFGSVLSVALASVSGCGAAQRQGTASPGAMAPPDTTRARASRDYDRDDIPPAPRAHVDPTACETAGKSVVVVARDAEGRPDRWRYFATRHGRRVLTCEAADANGDGQIDARYYYDPSGRLILEQRDLDFDGHAEVVADYSQFKPRRPLVKARHLQ